MPRKKWPVRYVGRFAMHLRYLFLEIIEKIMYYIIVPDGSKIETEKTYSALLDREITNDQSL